MNTSQKPQVPRVLVAAKQSAILCNGKGRSRDKKWDKGPWDKGHWANRKK